MKKKIPKHVEGGIDALLHPYGLCIATVTKEQLAIVPELVQSAVRRLLAPYQELIPVVNNNSDERYLPVSKAIKYCGVSRWTLSRAAKAGQLKEIKLAAARSGKVLYDRNELDRWMLNQQCI